MSTIHHMPYISISAQRLADNLSLFLLPPRPLYNKRTLPNHSLPSTYGVSNKPSDSLGFNVNFHPRTVFKTESRHTTRPSPLRVMVRGASNGTLCAQQPHRLTTTPPCGWAAGRKGITSKKSRLMYGTAPCYPTRHRLSCLLSSSPNSLELYRKNHIPPFLLLFSRFPLHSSIECLIETDTKGRGRQARRLTDLPIESQILYIRLYP